MAGTRFAKGKKSQRLGAEVVFWDEFGFSFQERLAPTWARKGKRPVFQRVTYDRHALSTAAALTLSGKIFKRHFEGAIRSEQTIQALKHLQRHIPGKIILIWDRARIHTSKKVLGYLSKHSEIRVELLPAYAPELDRKSIVMATSNNISEMFDHPINTKCVPCLIEALLVCGGDPIYCLASFMPQVFLLGNSS